MRAEKREEKREEKRGKEGTRKEGREERGEERGRGEEREAELEQHKCSYPNSLFLARWGILCWVLRIRLQGNDHHYIVVTP